MKEPKLSEHYVVQGLKRNKEVSTEVNEIETFLNEFEHSLKAYRIAYRFTATINITTKRYDKEKRFTIPICMHAEDTIIPRFGRCDSENLYKVLCAKILSTISVLELRWEGKIMRVDFEEADIDCSKEDIIIWTSDQVGTYHIEQECGEGWIMLPLFPVKRFVSYTNFNDKNS